MVVPGPVEGTCKPGRNPERHKPKAEWAHGCAWCCFSQKGLQVFRREAVTKMYQRRKRRFISRKTKMLQVQTPVADDLEQCA